MAPRKGERREESASVTKQRRRGEGAKHQNGTKEEDRIVRVMSRESKNERETERR